MRFTDSASHFRSHLSQGKLEAMRNAALSTAGFSAALLIFLSQVKSSPSYSEISLWAAIASLVIWLFGFQYVNTYLFHGEPVYRHINILAVAVIAFAGYTSLFIAVVATVWQISTCAGIALTILGIILAVAVVVHTKTVDRQCNESDA